MYRKSVSEMERLTYANLIIRDEINRLSNLKGDQTVFITALENTLKFIEEVTEKRKKISATPLYENEDEVSQLERIRITLTAIKNEIALIGNDKSLSIEERSEKLTNLQIVVALIRNLYKKESRQIIMESNDSRKGRK